VSKHIWKRFAALLVCILACLALGAHHTPAYAAIPNPGAQDGQAGLQGKVQTPAPTSAPTIGTPSNGQSFGKMPITVNGLCKTDLLVKVFANNIFVGSAICTSGSYTMQVTLLDGRNDLVARQFDALDQPSPDSNIVTVTYTNSQFENTGIPLLSLTSPYARKGANPGVEIIWPIVINGGTGPYAISVDWGDGKGQDLMSQPFAGTFNIKHTYQSAGIYTVIIKATDKNGLTAYLQLVGQANGQASGSTSSSSGNNGVIVILKVLWIPAALMIPLIILSFWLGRRYELLALRRKLERSSD
jgi:hypothetical protein